MGFFCAGPPGGEIEAVTTALTAIANKLFNGMGWTRTDYYETIIQRHIRTGRASNKSEVIHPALALLDAVKRGKSRSSQGMGVK